MKIAYLEDNAELAAIVCMWLREEGYEVEWFDNGEKCARAVTNDHFDACVFDWVVPGLSGPEVLARLKVKQRESMPPVIFTTGRDSEEDIVDVLNAGADDYIVKPLSRSVLLARLKVVLRRKGEDMDVAVQDFGKLSVNFSKRQFFLDGELVTMSERETDLALYFFKNTGRLLTREHLIKIIWALNPEIDTRTIDVHVSTLRRKLALTPENGWRLMSIYGRGYRLEKQ